MGWGSAGATIFNPTIDALVASNASEEVLFNTAVNLISTLQGEDWDTEQESLEYFKDNPAIVRAFGSLGIRLHHSNFEKLSDQNLADIRVYVDALNKGAMVSRTDATAPARSMLNKLLNEVDRLHNKLRQEYDETEP